MNGYIKIEINGKEIGLKFNRYAIEQFPDVKGKVSAMSNITTIVYCGMLGNCYAKQIDPIMSFEEISDWVDEVAVAGDAEGKLKAISDCFTDSVIIKGTIAKQENGAMDDDAKKKMVIAPV